MSATVVTALSDIREKTNIKIIDSSIQKINTLNGITFEWKDTKIPSVGVIAQQIENVLPELILNVNGKKTVNYNGLVGLLIEAVKEQQKQINNLKQSINI